MNLPFLFGRAPHDSRGPQTSDTTPTGMIATVSATMVATEAAWDEILSGVGDDADARAVARLIQLASRPSADPFYDNLAALVIELALLHLQARLCGAPPDQALDLSMLRDFFRTAPAERLIAIFQYSTDPTVRAAAEGVCATVLTHDRLRASAFVEATVRVNALSYTPPPSVDRRRGRDVAGASVALCMDERGVP